MTLAVFDPYYKYFFKKTHFLNELQISSITNIVMVVWIHILSYLHSIFAS